ncbi:hypothetical protein JKP88DRAFT_194853 [Tribonema minus]|uniref:Uncharacterized protein n=1 Tax=Tribonema minus TaxID=303371 RepID=A0A835Z1K5_9STRA|nr:hypothetical protein JKP88DRAFT_194853 [Tribonema minus]
MGTWWRRWGRGPSPSEGRWMATFAKRCECWRVRASRGRRSGAWRARSRGASWYLRWGRSSRRRASSSCASRCSGRRRSAASSCSARSTRRCARTASRGRRG